jgi:hypothetical protein
MPQQQAKQEQKIHWIVSIFLCCNKLLLFIISYSNTQPIIGLNGTKTLSNAVLHYLKVTWNEHYIEQQNSPWSQKDMEEHTASTC